MTILDSGATGHYFSTRANLPNRQPTTDPIRVTVANDQTIYSTHTAELPIPGIPREARTVHLFPAMSNNLIAVTPLTQAGCSIQFQGSMGTITCPNSEAIHCHLNPQGLWAFQACEDHLLSTVTPAPSSAPTVKPSHVTPQTMAWLHSKSKDSINY